MVLLLEIVELGISFAIVAKIGWKLYIGHIFFSILVMKCCSCVIGVAREIRKPLGF